MNVRLTAVLFCMIGLAAAGPSGAASNSLTGKMSAFHYLLAGKWTCKGGGATYAAEYVLAPGNTVHGHLYTGLSSEDAFFGYREAAHQFWKVSADTAGETESQTSADGITFTGKLNDGKTLSSATNTMTMIDANHWTDHARGVAGGQRYDLTVACAR